jgi:hypothetical protein
VNTASLKSDACGQRRLKSQPFRDRGPRPAKPLFVGKNMGKLKIKYVQRLPHGAEDLAPDVVELWISVSGRKVDFNIVRRGFILADPVMHAIEDRIERVAQDTAGINRPFAERIGFSPKLSSDWREFLDDLLQKSDSWSFLVNSELNRRLS